MSSTPPSPAPVSTAPAKKIVAGLTVTVLVGHWLALGGGIPSWPGQATNTASVLNAVPDLGTATEQGSLSPTEPGAPSDSPIEQAPVAVTASMVRWIAPPKPEPEPAPEPVAPPQAVPPPPPEPEKLPPTETEATTPVLDDLAQDPTVANDTPLAMAPEDPSLAPQDAPEPTPEPVAEPIQTAEPSPVPSPTPTPTPTPSQAPLPPPKPLASKPEPSATAAAPAKEANRAAAEPNTETSRLPATAQDTPLTLPPSGVLMYKVQGKASGFNYNANGTLTWTYDEGTYQAQQKISVFLLGTFLQTSTGQVTPSGLAPDSFSDSRRGKVKTAQFDYAAGRIHFSTQAPDAQLLPGAQDQLSATLQLATLLNANPNVPPGHLLKLPVSSTGYSEVWQFEVGPLKTVKLPAGEIDALLLTRGPRRPGDKTVQIWLAPSLGYLPVRMRLNERDGDFLDQLLSELPEISLPGDAPGSAPDV